MVSKRRQEEQRLFTLAGIAAGVGAAAFLALAIWLRPDRGGFIFGMTVVIGLTLFFAALFVLEKTERPDVSHLLPSALLGALFVWPWYLFWTNYKDTSLESGATLQSADTTAEQLQRNVEFAGEVGLNIFAVLGLVVLAIAAWYGGIYVIGKLVATRAHPRWEERGINASGLTWECSMFAIMGHSLGWLGVFFFLP